MSVKGLELPAYDPRGSYGMALAYGTSNRGACHLRAYPISQEILRKPVATDRFSFDGKARLIKVCEDTNAVIDSLAVCKFASLGASVEEYAQLLAAATGREYTGQELLKIGERIIERDRNQPEFVRPLWSYLDSAASVQRVSNGQKARCIAPRNRSCNCPALWCACRNPARHLGAGKRLWSVLWHS